jgi:hypothetical protein
VTDILLPAITFLLLLIVVALWRIGNAILSVYHALGSVQEVAEALWAQTGYTRKQWQEKQAEMRLNEHEQKSWEEFQRKQK